jgi:hypothetical protein
MAVSSHCVVSHSGSGVVKRAQWMDEVDGWVLLLGAEQVGV